MEIVVGTRRSFSSFQMYMQHRRHHDSAFSVVTTHLPSLCSSRTEFFFVDNTVEEEAVVRKQSAV